MSSPAGADATAVALVEAFRAAQNAGDVAGCLLLLHPEAVFDIGSGRFEGVPRCTSHAPRGTAASGQQVGR
jgi:hypothetical protein